MTASAPAMAMAAVVSGMVALSATSYAGNDVQYPRSGLRLSSGLKVRPEPSRLMYKYKLRGEKSRNAYIVRSTAQVLEEESGAAQVLEEESGATQVLEEESGAAAGAGGDSVVSEVALLEEEPETPGVFGAAASKRKAGPLARGGTLSGEEALGKDPSTAIRGKKSEVSEAGVFEDPRWIKGTWDLTKFTKEGKVNWDSVIDAEVKRRKWLEDNPEASTNDEPVVFESGVIPWWAWVKRFHLPEAELLNGRAAMVGYVAAYLVDSATGVGLVDQQSSFFGKLLLFITILAILLIRKNEDVETLKTLAKESTFYDKQWQASWKEDSTKDEKPSE